MHHNETQLAHSATLDRGSCLEAIFHEDPRAPDGKAIEPRHGVGGALVSGHDLTRTYPSKNGRGLTEILGLAKEKGSR